MNRLIAVLSAAAMAIGLSGCNNDDCDERVECGPRCSCRAPLVGHAEAVPAPAPLAEAPVKAPETPAVVKAPEKPAVVQKIERPAEYVYTRPSAPVQRSYSTTSYSKLRTGEIQE